MSCESGSSCAFVKKKSKFHSPPAPYTRTMPHWKRHNRKRSALLNAITGVNAPEIMLPSRRIPSLVRLPLGEDQAMLDPHNLQHAVEVESRRLDLGADLFLGHSRGFVERAEGMAF